MRPFALLFLVALGCGHADARSHLVVGPFAREPSVLWTQALEASRALRYQPTEADPGRGRIVVPARYVGRWGTGARFEVQLYREGWVQVGVAGMVVQPRGAGMVKVPKELRAELEAYVMGMREQLASARTPEPTSEAQAPPAAPAPSAPPTDELEEALP